MHWFLTETENRAICRGELSDIGKKFITEIDMKRLCAAERKILGRIKGRARNMEGKN
jgi:hypothetical protein